MKHLILISALLLAGCYTVPAVPDWPRAPNVGSCPELDEAMPSEKLSELLIVITKNYGKYHECSARVDAWQEWYKKQKKIYQEAN